jgi:uncharacterized membrane protein
VKGELRLGIIQPLFSRWQSCFVTGRRVDSGLREAGERDEPDQYPRVQRRAPTFSDLLRMSYGEIRQAASGNLAALEAIARSIDTLDRVTTRPARRRVLRTQAEALLVSLQDAYLPPCDVDGLRARIVERIASLSISASLPTTGDSPTTATGYGG